MPLCITRKVGQRLFIRHAGETLILKMGEPDMHGSRKLFFDGPHSFDIQRAELAGDTTKANYGK